MKLTADKQDYDKMIEKYDRDLKSWSTEKPKYLIKILEEVRNFIRSSQWVERGAQVEPLGDDLLKFTADAGFNPEALANSVLDHFNKIGKFRWLAPETGHMTNRLRIGWSFISAIDKEMDPNDPMGKI